ncbi:galactokinase [Nakamurella flavida]|uniref:Galactokinase n=1 Tax=Nakamurella flavida TaxID=363630 RepID=A0A938YL69_9ACTN|nr:galactokinase [Nakamurella flavida]MBM9476733.1 galactokinase [Nakamurella flavida]MDP9778829.1 galactokinase [Nakamurella flavida]
MSAATTQEVGPAGVTALFRRSYDRAPEGVFSSPGRVNLIGEHTDYTGGLVLPFAIDARAYVAAARIDEPVVRLVAGQRPGSVREFALADLAPGGPGAGEWTGYLLGAVWAAARAGIRPGGLALALDSGVPSGAGLSSSAALECATVLAVASLAGVQLPVTEIARLALRAENDFVGVPCGPMDQMASAASQEGSVLRFDTSDGSIAHIPFDPDARGLTVLAIDTRVSHSLGDGEYARRRASVERAAEILGLRWLRDLPSPDLDAALVVLGGQDGHDGGDGDVLARRTRHVVTENARVEATVELLESGDIAGIGPLLTASHVSLRDDFAVSSVELDVAVDAALAAGALGARMVGGGFGGSALALVEADHADRVRDAVLAAFGAHGFTAPVIRAVLPAQGARVES